MHACRLVVLLAFAVALASAQEYGLKDGSACETAAGKGTCGGVWKCPALICEHNKLNNREALREFKKKWWCGSSFVYSRYCCVGPYYDVPIGTLGKDCK